MNWKYNGSGSNYSCIFAQKDLLLRFGECQQLRLRLPGCQVDISSVRGGIERVFFLGP